MSVDEPEPATHMTRAEYARHRGVSKPYITKIVAEGRIEVVDGLIDRVAADASLGEPVKKLQPLPGASPVAQPSPPLPSPHARHEQEHQQPGKKPKMSIAETRQVLISLQAQRISLELEGTRKESVNRRQMESAFAEAMVIIASQLDGLGGRLAVELAGMSNPAEIQALILLETRRARAAAAALLEEKINGG